MYMDEDSRRPGRLAKGLAARSMKPLEENFVPGENDVICGYGRSCFEHIGNARFREMVTESLEDYSGSSSKLGKTIIICEIVNKVRQNSPNGGFVRADPMTGRFFEVGDFLAVRKFELYT